MSEQEGQERLSHRLGNGLLFIVNALWQGLLFIFHILDGLIVWMGERIKGLLFILGLIMVWKWIAAYPITASVLGYLAPLVAIFSLFSC